MPIKKGTKFSEDHKKKISEAHKGLKKPWAGFANRGRELSIEHKIKIGMKSALHFKDLTSQKFGLLTVLSKDNGERKAHSRIKWVCKCECGNIKSISTSHLKSGNTTSCGCRQKAIIKELTARRTEVFKGQHTKNATYYTYMKRASHKEIEFSLSIQKFIELTSENCFYCGSAPSNKTSNPYNNGDYIYNGLDRLNCKQGYTEENCVPCCKVCNTAKGVMTYEQFINHIRSILDNLNQKQAVHSGQQ